MSDNTAKWPVIAGSYQVGNPNAPVAVCTLTSERLMSPLASLPGVAIAGMVYTANLGITRIIVNITANPAIRFLLICGKDSQLFQPGQSLAALADHGVDEQRRIIGATGYEPVLPTLAPAQIAQFRKQVEILDWTEEEDLDTLKQRISDLSARNPGPFPVTKDPAKAPPGEQFAPIRPGGQREPLIYDPKGYFVISIEPEKEEIVLRHYLPDHTPAHEMRGRGATSMLLGLLREGLVTQLSHAGYLGEELAKAQTALQFNLRYDQDRPLRPREPPARVTSEGSVQPANQQAAALSPTKQATPTIPRITIPMSWKQMQAAAPNSVVDVVLMVTDIPQAEFLRGTFLEPDESEPFTAFRKIREQIEVQWTSTTRFAMGTSSDLADGALIRVRGKLTSEHVIQADQLVILTRTARILS